MAMFQPPQDKFQRMRKVGEKILSPKAQQKLEWMIFYFTVGRRHALNTSRHFGVSSKTFHKYLGRFNETNLKSLEERSRAPLNVRQSTVTSVEEGRVIELRNQTKRIRGKKKLQRYYQNKYQAKISTHKIQQTINKFHLYPNKVDRQLQVKRVQHQKRNQSKIRMHQFTKEKELGFLWHTDSVIVSWYGQRRVIITALEEQTKVAFAHIYSSGSSRSATDFLKRLLYLSNNQVINIHHDNGSEFAGEFEKSCKLLDVQQIYSRVRRPKDNAALERFNRTIQEEWLAVSEVGLDELAEANHSLTEWLVEYNFQRPHQSLDYQTPIEYATLNYPLSPMWPASTSGSIKVFAMP
jgi:Integrase core domain